MEIRSQDEVMENIKSYAIALIEKQLEKKQLDEDIKTIKDNFKEEGVPVSLVTKVMNKIKAKMKQSEADALEEDIIMEKLEADEVIQSNIAALIEK
jgi:uncharacterized protein (UPF0335 family)